MKLRALFLTLTMLFSVAFGSATFAESWKTFSEDGAHGAHYKEEVFLNYSTPNKTWYLTFGINDDADVNKPMVTLIGLNGSKRRYNVNTDFIKVSPRPVFGIKTLSFPIDLSTLEQLQSNATILLELGQDTYSSPLKGSRKAISTAMERVAHDAAVADDEQHAIAQAESDAAQAKARQAKSVALGGVQHWTYRGRKSVGTIVESFEASASVDDDIMSLVYLPHDDAFSLWFTLNGNQILSNKHAQRAEIFIRTRQVSGGGRYDSDYVFKGKTVAQPDRNPLGSQFVVAKLTPEDIRALRQYDGMDIGAGYFIGDDWTTYRLSGKDLWKSFVELAVAANRTDLLQ